MTAALLAGGAHGVGTRQDEDSTRTTVEPIRTDSETSELNHDPEWNEVETDHSGELVGLSPRAVSGDTHDTNRYAPWWASLADAPHNQIIDAQVSSSGTAAARESAGQQGHGTMQYTSTLEPVIRDGGAYGNDYFVSNDMGANELSGAYMTPVDTDNWAQTLVARNAESNSRKAFQASQYAAFLAG